MDWRESVAVVRRLCIRRGLVPGHNLRDHKFEHARHFFSAKKAISNSAPPTETLDKVVASILPVLVDKTCVFVRFGMVRNM